MALKRRKLLKQALNLGYGTDTIPADSGGSLVGDKIGVHTFLGLAYFSVGDFDGSDIGERMQAAITALPPTGGVIDARSLIGSQDVRTDPFLSSGGKPIVLLLGPNTYNTYLGITIPSNATIIGMNDRSTVIKAATFITRMLDARDALGVTMSDLTIDGNAQAQTGIDLSNSVDGTSTTNRIYRTRIYNTTTVGINMDNNGDSTLEDMVFDVDSGVSIKWDDRGGNINLTRVAAINANDATHLAFQTCCLVDCSLRDVHITFGSEQLRCLGGYLYSGFSGVFTVDTGAVLRQADFIGTRFEITDVFQTGSYAIDGKFVTGLFLTDPKFGNAQNVAGRNVFGPNFGSSGITTKVWIHGGTVATEVVNSPTFNPSGVLVDVDNFITGAGIVRSYKNIGPVGNDGTAAEIIASDDAARVPLIVSGATSQAADLNQWKDSSGNILAKIASNGSFQIGQTGTPFRLYSGTATWDPGSMADAAIVSTTFTVTGAALGDVVYASHSLIGPVDVLISAHVNAADTVRVVMMNKTGAPLDIGSGTVRAMVIHF